MIDISTKSTLAADVYKITNENNNFRSIESFEKKINDLTAHVTMPLATYIHRIAEDAIVDSILKENGRQVSANITPTTTIQICSANETNAINVTNLTSSTFTAAITYDCVSIEPSDLEIHYNTVASCCITKHSESMTLNSTVDVTCQSIENQAGRNFTFVLTQRNRNRNQLIENETFIVTLEPLPLNNSANILIIPDESLSSASITVQNCEKIAELEYLVFECDIVNQLNRFRLENCTQTCDNLQPGSSYEAALIRLPIPVYGTNRTFLEDRITQKYQIDLDKTKNMTFNSTMIENGTGIIHFTPPRGYYEKIHFDCVAKDQNCSESVKNLTASIDNYSNRSYELRVELNANHRTLSEPIIVKTKSAAPKRPTPIDVENKIVPQNDDKASTTNQYVINVDLSLFSDEYGIVEKYLIYVRQDLNNNDSEIFLSGTYVDAWHNASFDYLAVEIPIISLTTLNLPIKPGSSKSWVVVFPLLFLVIIASLAVWKRKQLQGIIDRKTRQSNRHADDERDRSMPLSSVSTIPMKKPKPLFRYVNMTNEDERSIYDEYQELDDSSSQYRQSECDLQYKDYNRYSNISARGPWDSTAVRLRAVGSNPRDHDYINANEIKGLHGEKQYIACQGPLQETCEDFWDMIIQYGVKKIVMLTRIEEQNPHNPAQKLPKCARYFPEKKGDVLRISRISIEVIDIENQPDLEIRHLFIKYDNNDHHVFHYYFAGWPDFSVVDPQELINLIENINKHKSNRPISVEKMKEILLTPIVVHCSAGVGRTGTYIAVDIIMSLIDRQKNELSTMKLDVMGIVYHLRQDRGKMVQTKDQYMLVNNCVEEYLRRTNRLNSVLKSAPKYQTTIHTAELTSTENRTHLTNSNDTAAGPVNEQFYKRT
ncbi:unnamed protein product [Rotaria magnacalcarata]|uniref:Protein-tyrosine-phosphatase n=1 Tax=Rotaria magnacalcarata TaxID=392030 RepID=A0A815ZWU3_9BILA|nr:unnamed protein product [Rotaria magnacalcarata]